MITIILPATEFPEYSKVRKPGGAKLYVLRHKFPVYGLGEEVVNIDPSIVFLVSDYSVNAIPCDTELAIDFNSKDAAIEFLQGSDEA